MRRAATLVTALAIVVFASAIQAQKATDFNGKWTADTEKNQAAGPPPAGNAKGGRGGGGGAMTAFTVTQNDKTLTVERDMNGTAMKTTYNLDGSDSKNMGMGRGGQTEQVSNAKWDGAKLVITTKNPNGDQVQTWSMEEGEIVIARTTQAGVQKTYYKKAM